MIKGITHITLTVKELKRSKNFYLSFIYSFLSNHLKGTSTTKISAEAIRANA